MELSREAIKAKSIPMAQFPIHPTSSPHSFESFPSTMIPQQIPIKHRKKFSAEEDEILTEMVEKFGPKKWNRIAQYLPFRTARQCRDRYCNYLAPGFFNGEWLQEEDDLLYEKYQEIGPKWAQMKIFFKNRSPNSLKNRWNYFVSKMHPQAQPPNKSRDQSQDESQDQSQDQSPKEIEKEESPKSNELPLLPENLSDTISVDSDKKIIIEEKENVQDNLKIYYDFYISNCITELRKTELNNADLEEIYPFPSLSQTPMIPIHTEETEPYDLSGLSFDIGSPIPF